MGFASPTPKEKSHAEFHAKNWFPRRIACQKSIPTPNSTPKLASHAKVPSAWYSAWDSGSHAEKTQSHAINHAEVPLAWDLESHARYHAETQEKLNCDTIDSTQNFCIEKVVQILCLFSFWIFWLVKFICIGCSAYETAMWPHQWLQVFQHIWEKWVYAALAYFSFNKDSFTISISMYTYI